MHFEDKNWGFPMYLKIAHLTCKVSNFKVITDFFKKKKYFFSILNVF